MKKPTLLLSIISIFSCSCLAQTKYDEYEKLIYEADSLKEIKYYSEAIDKYEKALIEIVPEFITPYINLVECAIIQDDLSLADKWIRKSVSEGGVTKTSLKLYSQLLKSKDEDFFQKILSDYNLLRRQFFSSIEDIDLYLEMKELNERDQFVRKIDDYMDGRTQEDIQNAMKGYQEAKEQNDTIAINKYRAILFPKPNKEYEKLQTDLMLKVDSLNIVKLMDITREHGWQKEGWLILWHQRGTYGENNIVWNYFIPLINKEIEEGKLSRSFWVQFDEFKRRKDSRKIEDK